MGIFVNSFLSTSKTVTSPLSIPGCDLWLDATTGLYDASNNPITTNGAAITRWADSSGNGHSFTQSSVIRKPTIVTNSLNGLRGVNFTNSSGVAQYLDGGQICNLTGPEGGEGSLVQKSFYIALVHKFNNPTPSGTYETILSKSGGYVGFYHGGYALRRWDYLTPNFPPQQNNRYCIRYDVNGNFDVGIGDYTSTSPTYTLWSMPRTVGRMPIDVTMDINGVNVITQSVNDQADRPTTTTLHRLSLGTQLAGTAFTPNDGTAFLGTIYEVIIYKREAPLTIKELTGLRRYIKNKWNI